MDRIRALTNRGGLRARIALAAVVALVFVILVGGGLVAILVSVTQHRALDRRLAQQASAVQGQVLKEVQQNNANLSLDLADQRPDVGTIIRVYRNDSLIGAVGSIDVTFPTPNNGGYSTEPAGGRLWRVLDRYVQPPTSMVSSTASNTPIVLETAVPTSATDELVDNLRRTVFEVATVGAIIAAISGYLLGSVAIRPLARLRHTAEQVANSRDLSVRVSETKGPTEINDLASSLNVMLQRLQEASTAMELTLESSRTFAGNAAHELRTPLTSMQANLDVLVGNPSLPDSERNEIIAAVASEQARIVSLLDALHVLARGEVIGDAQKEPMDLSDLVGLSIDGIRRRFPDVRFEYSLPSAATELNGWRDGLSVLVDNLLTNAARHGGHVVEVSIVADDETMELIVDDDGPGVPADERATVFDRFARGRNTTVQGTGLGLALVAQQSRIHGGDVTVEDSPLGGARFVVRLPTS